MTKRCWQILEQAFAAEIAGLLPAQFKSSKPLTALVDAGYLVAVTATLPGRFAVTVEGYALTDAGHLVFCEWAAKQSDVADVADVLAKECQS